MAWYPEAVKKLIKPGPNDPPIVACGAILHVDSGDASSLFSYFNGRSDGIESHFFVKKDGSVEQYRDTAFEADANLKANSFLDTSGVQIVRKGFVSIETQGKDAGEWTDAQIATLKRLLRWLSETHDFPLRVCATPTSPGVGYHTLFGSPGPWTPYTKTCPGPDRVRQFNNVLVPWMAQETGTEDDMTPAQMQELKDFIEARLDAYFTGMQKWERQTDKADAERAADATVAKLGKVGK